MSVSNRKNQPVPRRNERFGLKRFGNHDTVRNNLRDPICPAAHQDGRPNSLLHLPEWRAGERTTARPELLLRGTPAVNFWLDLLQMSQGVFGLVDFDDREKRLVTTVCSPVRRLPPPPPPWPAVRYARSYDCLFLQREQPGRCFPRCFRESRATCK